MSRILITLTSLWSCLVTWSIGCTAPSSVKVIREMLGSSVGPTARVSMLKPRRLNRPAILASTPGLFSTRSERTCLRPVSALEASRSSSLTRSGVPASITPLPTSSERQAASGSSDHVPRGGAGGDHREAGLRLGHVDVEEHRPVGLERSAHRIPQLALVGAPQPGPSE